MSIRTHVTLSGAAARGTLILSALSLLACSEPVSPTAAAPTITVTPGQASLVSIGETARLTATDENGVAKTAAWTSSAPAIVSVDSDGTVTAMANGSATITATVDTLTAMTSVTVTQKAVRLAFVTAPTATKFSVTMPAIEVRVEDARGNLVPTSLATVTLALGANPAAGALSGSLQTDAVNGVATFSDVAIDKAAVGYTMRATAANLADAASDPFEIMDVAIRIDSVRLANENVKIGGSTAYSAWITNGSGHTLTLVALQGYLMQNNASNAAGGASVFNCGSSTPGTIVPGSCRMDWALYATSGSYTAGAATAAIELNESGVTRGTKTIPVTMVP